MPAIHVAALAIYPLKGARAIALDEVVLDALGPSGDRRYCLSLPSGRAFTQRDDARLARLTAQPRADALVLEFDGETLEVPANAFAADARLRVWSRNAAAQIATETVNARLSSWFGAPLQLARLERPVVRGDRMLAFGDAAALLLANAASLDALNAALDSPVPMTRFRPNLVLAGAAAYAEHGWGRMRIGGAVVAPVEACGRCEVTTIDQAFGAAVGGEPLRTLSRLRVLEGEPVFGVRYSVEHPGRMRIGDRAELID